MVTKLKVTLTHSFIVVIVFLSLLGWHIIHHIRVRGVAAQQLLTACVLGLVRLQAPHRVLVCFVVPPTQGDVQ